MFRTYSGNGEPSVNSYLHDFSGQLGRTHDRGRGFTVETIISTNRNSNFWGPLFFFFCVWSFFLFVVKRVGVVHYFFVFRRFFSRIKKSAKNTKQIKPFESHPLSNDH